MVEIKASDALGIFIRSLNRIDPRLIDHGGRVAYIVFHLLQADGKYDTNTVREIALITLMHDIGAYKTEEIDKMLEFESANIWEHSVYGYLFVKKLTPFSAFAPAILFHHTNHRDLLSLDSPHKDIAQIINLADRVDTYLRTQGRVGVEAFVDGGENIRFSPQVLQLFHAAQDQYDFMRSIFDGSYKEALEEQLSQYDFSGSESYDFLKMVMYVIDFRSVFTVTHTITTMGISDELGRLMEIYGDEAQRLHIGAQLHDLGKISIPIDILEKPGKLTPQEMEVMRTHVDITEEVLGHAVDEIVLKNAIRHHEKLDGSGYPRGLLGSELTRTERIVAVADIISALIGRRSYKDSFPKEKIIAILDDLAGNNKICPEVVEMVKDHYDSIMDNVRIQCGPAIALYESINYEYEILIEEFHKIVS